MNKLTEYELNVAKELQEKFPWLVEYSSIYGFEVACGEVEEFYDSDNWANNPPTWNHSIPMQEYIDARDNQSHDWSDFDEYIKTKELRNEEVYGDIAMGWGIDDEPCDSAKVIEDMLYTRLFDQRTRDSS
ncbi:hypothetical protein [Vibrio owensii]|uniref:hypothetical protein n=1 Tax=Vibrio owensii TaxID=696485 RepID=UPI004068F360